MEIIIHPESLVHAIFELKNGLFIFIYHDTSMVIPIANALFESKLEISTFISSKNTKKNKELIFLKTQFENISNL